MRAKIVPPTARHLRKHLLPWLAVTAATIASYSEAQRPAPLDIDSDYIEVLPVQGNIHMIVTGGSNIAVQTGSDGALLVDTGAASTAERVVAEIARLSERPIRYIINSSLDVGHIGGNTVVAAAGEPMGGNVVYLGALTIPIVGHQNGIDRLVLGKDDEVPAELWPDTTFSGPKKTHYINGESIEILLQPNAVTDSDVFVYFRRSDVLATGDVYRTDAYPRFFPDRGGSLQGLIDALNRIIDITIPAFNQQGGTLVVPGHGRISNESDVVEYRDMLTIVRDRIESMIGRGMSRRQIHAVRPTLEYDGLYGADEGPWTTTMFIDAVYDDLRRSADAAGRSD